MWETYDIYLVEQDDEIKTIARRYLNVDDDKVVSDAAWKIRAENRIEMKRFAVIDRKAACRADRFTFCQVPHQRGNTRARGSLTAVLRPHCGQNIRRDHAGSRLPHGRHTFGRNRRPLCEKRQRDKRLVELHIPFTIAVNDSVTAMAMDESERLWVGTPHGLWRTSESKWNRTTVADGLPSNVITAIALGAYGELAVAPMTASVSIKTAIGRKLTIADGLPDSVVYRGHVRQRRRSVRGYCRRPLSERKIRDHSLRYRERTDFAPGQCTLLRF